MNDGHFTVHYHRPGALSTACGVDMQTLHDTPRQGWGNYLYMANCDACHVAMTKARERGEGKGVFDAPVRPADAGPPEEAG